MQRVHLFSFLTVVVTAVIVVGVLSVWKVWRLPTEDHVITEANWFTLTREKVVASQSTATVPEQPQSLANTEATLKKAPFTALYLADLPPDTPNNEVLQKEKLEQFAEAHLGDILPALPEKMVLGAVSDDEVSRQRYFAAVLPHMVTVTTSATVSAATLQQAEQALLEWQKAPAPSGLLVLHTDYQRALTSYVYSLRLFLKSQEDPVGALIANKQLERLEPVIDDFNKQLQAVQQLGTSLISPSLTP